MSAAPILRVAIDTPLRRLFDYLPPPEADPDSATPGVRVRVPFGKRRVIGVVVARAAESDLGRERLRAAYAILDPRPILDPVTLGVLEWAAAYYHHPIGEVMAAALPKALRSGAAAREAEECWLATPAGAAGLAAGEPRRAPAQRALLQQLVAAADTGLTPSQLATACPGWRMAARALVRRGFIASAEPPPPQAPGAFEPDPAAARGARPEPTQEQAQAVAAVRERLGQFGAWLLYGITGSGKTEVYLRLIERVLARGRRVLVLVPEIGLTPQLVMRFHERFNVALAVVHSGLTDRERLEAWRACFDGTARIVIGTRSAVFAPVPALGLIVIDEEHDASFKQHEGGFRYSARDLAVVRAQSCGVPIIMGSATPCLETLHNAATGRYTRLLLPRRAAQAQPPRVKLVDLRAEATRGGIAGTALEAMRQHLGSDGQVLVFINRRGYAPTLVCTACGWIAPCRDCDARLVVHRAARRLRCHHCGAETPLPQRCVQCGYEVKPVGHGTERLEETLGEIFPSVPLARLDRDVARQRGDLEAVMQRVASGETRILVGTQMLTKGHHFPGVTLVVVLNGDQGLFSADFRAAERLAQTIVQVGGRAGRGERAGEVLIQTEYPEHPLLASLLREGYEGFARAALAERAAARWPPFSRLAALRASGLTPDAALEFLREARRVAQPADGVQLRGPVPAAMVRRAGRYRAQLLVESAGRGALHRFLDGWLPQVEASHGARRVHWALDVDPLELF